MKVVSSRSNPVFKALLKLKSSAHARRVRATALLEGAHLVAAYLDRVGPPRLLVVGQSAMQGAEVQALRQRVEPRLCVLLDDSLARELSSVSSPPGIFAEVDIPAPVSVPSSAEGCVLLENIQDSGNVGSILRSAAAAGLSHVLLSDGCADAWSPRVLRAAMGAHFYLNIVEHADLTDFARSYRGQVVALMGRGPATVFEIDLTRPTAIVAGNEGAGISAALAGEADVQASVPMPGGVESLNVGAAAAVCFFERLRQRMVAERNR